MNAAMVNGGIYQPPLPRLFIFFAPSSALGVPLRAFPDPAGNDHSPSLLRLDYCVRRRNRPSTRWARAWALSLPPDVFLLFPLA